MMKVGVTLAKRPPRTRHDDLTGRAASDYCYLPHGVTHPCGVEKVLAVRRYAKVGETGPGIRREGLVLDSAPPRIKNEDRSTMLRGVVHRQTNHNGITRDLWQRGNYVSNGIPGRGRTNLEEVGEHAVIVAPPGLPPH